MTATRGLGIAMTLSLQLVAAVIIGLLLGRWLDGLLHTGPLFTILGVLLGMGSGMWGVYRLARVLLK